ncbi:hypothetical protein FACS1894170_10220 [Planctomycetales bacterium]|nr:hypothetical protein FACS1894170_10220 [Planctomycetales bacterium]
MPTKEEARQIVSQLVEKYRSQIGTYESAHYDEANTRRDFLDALFDALNWDIGNKEGLAQSHRKTILEDKVIVDGNSKAADYAFRDGKTIQFYVEAKKPSVNIKNNQEAVFQLRRYGWSNRDVNISILTNFKEFAVYDCTKQPNVKDKPHVARLTYLTFEDFGETATLDGGRDGFDFLWDTLEYNNVLCHSLDKYLKNNSDKQGSVTVDEAFLQLLESRREVLAKSVCRTNQGISEEDLNFAVHEILNRIVFLRMMESRKIETFGNLQRTVESNQCYKKLITLFQRADEKYNSGLFNFDRDKVSEKLTVEDTVLKTMINELYETSPYNFSQIPVEILGSVYERFLGKTIRLTSSGKNVKVEEKPEVRKAGGVYYTPQHIVNYIVENTVGKLLAGKTPKAAEKIKVVDPACGSGSFLLGAYQFLLDWHKDYYFANDYNNGKVKSKGLKTDKLTPDYQLTATEKKKILLNNIFGVDIDIIAVEVAKLSLLIKCVEGETEASIENTLWLFHEKALPDIDGNIRDGNSLIDTDFYDNNFDFGDERKIKPFNWERAFPQVFKQGGFDAVIGNPPWVSLNGKFGNDILNVKARQYLITKYQGNTYMPNLYEYFVHRGLMLINKAGIFSFIIPDRLGFNKQFVLLRKKIVANFQIEDLLYKTPFPGTRADTLIFQFTQKIDTAKNTSFTVGEYQSARQTKTIKEYQDDPDCRFTYEANDMVSHILCKIFANPKCQSLGNIAETTSGVGAKISEITTKRKNLKQVAIIRGRSINKYSSINPFFFEFNKENITGRTVDRNKLGCKEKVLLRKTGYPIYATYDKSGTYPEQSLYFIFNNTKGISLKYLTGLFNSKLFQFIYIYRLVTNKNTTPQLKKVDLDMFPVRICAGKDRESHDLIVRMVDGLLRLYNEKAEALVSPKLHRIEEKITYCEDKINKLVYQLYGLTDEEIKIVEGE